MVCELPVDLVSIEPAIPMFEPISIMAADSTSPSQTLSGSFFSASANISTRFNVNGTTSKFVM